MPNIYMRPAPAEFEHKEDNPSDGIRMVVESISGGLTDRGWTFSSRGDADITAAHACAELGASVAHVHGLYPTAEAEFNRWVWKTNAKVIESVRRAQAVTVPSPWVAEMFARNMGFLPTVIGHGIDLDDWPEPTTDSRTSILWLKNRNVDVCYTAPVERLASMLPDLKFTSTFGKQAANLEVTGPLAHSNIKDLLYHGQIYLSTTKETFGIGTLEALAAGVPVLGWNWGHTPFLVEHEITGYLAEPYNYEDSVRGIAFILKHFREMSISARESARGYSWDSIAAQYDQLYRSVMERRSGPLVTFVVPCYNYGRYIRDAIQSIQRQTFGDWECYLVDDGSTDDSLEVMLATVRGDNQDDRFKILKRENSGVAASRNRGAMLGKGKYVAFLDADDILDHEFLERLLPALEDSRAVAISYGRIADFVDGNPNASKSQWPGDFDFDAQLGRRNQVPSCNLMRRDIFLRTGGFRQRSATAEDAELWTRVGLLGYSATKATDEVVYFYRMHEGSETAKESQEGKKQPDWLGWISAANGGVQPFASLAKSEKSSHPVRAYDKPLVSIIVPVGDGHEDLVLDAIDSVAAQTYPDWELIVVDDTTKGNLTAHGSVPYGIAFPYVRWMRCGDRNVAKARNMGADAARGPYLCFLDADDILYKDFLRQTMRYIGNRMVYTDWIELPSGKVHRAEEFDIAGIRNEGQFAVTFLHPRVAWEEVGGFDPMMIGWEDWDYQIALAMKGYHGLRIPEPLFAYNYASGARRESSLDWKEALVRAIRSKWADVEPKAPLDERLDVAQTHAQVELEGPEGGLAEVIFVGPGLGSVLYRVPSGNSYRFGAGRHKRHLVSPEDGRFFENRRNFTVNYGLPGPSPGPVAMSDAVRRGVPVTRRPARSRAGCTGCG